MLKKILSTVCALSMAFAMMTSFNVVNAEGEPTISFKLEQKDFDPGNADYADYTQYVLKASVENIPNVAFTTSGIGANKKYTGTAVNAVEIDLSFDPAKVGMCDVVCLLAGGSPVPNAEEAYIQWTSTSISEYITETSFDIAEFHFVALADAEWTPAVEDFTSNPFSMGDNATVKTITFNNQKPSDVGGAVINSLSVNSSSLTPVFVAYPEVVAPTKYAVTVTGGTADVAEAEEGQVVTVTANIPEGKQIASVTGADVTKTGDATYTFTMPAAAVEIVIAYEDIPAPEFSAVATKSATQYYTGVAEDVKTVQVFDVTATNPELAQWIFTFTSGADSKEFDADMSAISGGASAVFQAWIVGAPADVQLSVQ